MTAEVTKQSGYVGLMQDSLVATKQSGYVGLMQRGLDMTKQTAYIGLFLKPPPSAGRRRMALIIN